MGFVLATDEALATFVYRNSGVSGDKTFSMGFDVVDYVGDADDIATDLATLEETDGWITVMGDTSSFVECNVLLQRGAGVTVGTHTSVATGGGGTFALPPPQVALVVSKVTEFAGKANRGRSYIPFVVGESIVDSNGRIDSGSVSTFQGVASALIAGWAALDLDATLLHAAPAVGPPAPATQLTTLLVRGVVGSQRRRLIR